MDNHKLKRKVYEFFAKNKDYRIVDIVSQLDLELPIKKRFTFSFESQIKATIFMQLKGFKSQHQLVDHLLKNDLDAIQLGFSKNDTGKIEIPTRRAFSKFIKNLDKEYLELVTSAVFAIKKTADEFNIALDNASRNYKKRSRLKPHIT